MGQSAWFQRSDSSPRPTNAQNNAPNPNGASQNDRVANEEERREEEAAEVEAAVVPSSSSDEDSDDDGGYLDVSPIRQFLGLGRTLAEIDRASVSYNYLPPPRSPSPSPSTSTAASGAGEEDPPTCSICFENFKPSEHIRKLRCRHEFHSDCLVPWLKMRTTCPVCRRKISTGIWWWW